MAKRPTDEGSDSMRMFGCTAKAFRVRAGLTHDQVAEAVGYSKSLVVCVERGTRMPSAAMVEKLDEVCQANGVLIEASKHLSRQRYPSWFETYAAEEARAFSLCMYDTHVINGLFQTEDYARAVFDARYPVLDMEEIERHMQARMERQELFLRKSTMSVSSVIEEWMLRRPVGGRAAHKRQLEHLLELAGLRNVSIQVMPTAYETHAGFEGPLTLLERPDRQWIGYVENQVGGLLVEDRDEVSEMQQRYGMIRTQALTPGDSITLIKELVGEL